MVMMKRLIAGLSERVGEYDRVPVRAWQRVSAEQVAPCQRRSGPRRQPQEQRSAWMQRPAVLSGHHVRGSTDIDNIHCYLVMTLKMHGLDTSNVSSRVISGRDEPSGIWAIDNKTCFRGWSTWLFFYLLR